MNQPNYLALDLGGTKIDVCRFDTNYNLLENFVLRTCDYRARSFDFEKDVKKIIHQFINKETIKIGVSWNCLLNKGIVVWSSLLGGLVKYPLAKELENEFSLPIQTDDDIHSMTNAEKKFGWGKTYPNFILINIGTGIGAGYYENGIIRGANNVAGIYAFHPIYVEELQKSIAIENLVSGRGIEEIYTYYSGREKTAHAVCDSVNNDNDALKAIDLFARYFAKHLVDISLFYNPSVAVINGSVKKSSHVFLPKTLDFYYSEMRAIGEGERDPRVKNKKDLLDYRWGGEIENIFISELDHAACLGVIC